MKSDNAPLHSEGRGRIKQENNRKMIVLRKGRGLGVTNRISANTWLLCSSLLLLSWAWKVRQIRPRIFSLLSYIETNIQTDMKLSLTLKSFSYDTIWPHALASKERVNCSAWRKVVQHCSGVAAFKLWWPGGGEHRAKDKRMLGLLPLHEYAVHFTLEYISSIAERLFPRCFSGPGGKLNVFYHLYASSRCEMCMVGKICMHPLNLFIMSYGELSCQINWYCPLISRLSGPQGLRNFCKVIKKRKTDPIALSISVSCCSCVSEFFREFFWPLILFWGLTSTGVCP